MPIEELQEPYWEKQQGETPNQYCYFQEFLKFPTNNLKDFHQHLCETYQHLPTPTAKPPKYNTVKGWSSDNKWTDRKTQKRMAEKQDILDTLHELDKEDAIEEYLLKKSFKKKLLKRLEQEAEDERFSQLKHGVAAYVEMNNDNRVDKEEPTNFTSQKMDVETENHMHYESVDNLLEAFHASKNEWNKHKHEHE